MRSENLKKNQEKKKLNNNYQSWEWFSMGILGGTENWSRSFYRKHRKSTEIIREDIIMGILRGVV